MFVCLFVCLSSQMKFIYKGNPFIFICDDRSSQMNHFHHKWNWRDFFVNWEEKLVSSWVLAILRKFLHFHLWWPHFIIFLPLRFSTDCRSRWKLRNHNTNEMVANKNECLREWHYLLVALAVRMELVIYIPIRPQNKITL